MDAGTGDMNGRHPLGSTGAVVGGLGAGTEIAFGVNVEEARRIAQALLSELLPRRWFHTIGVARTAEVLARALVPEWAEEIVAAAWLHDIGYAPALIDTGFHPIDGAAYVLRDLPQSWKTVAYLVAHHTGAAFEAHERGLDAEMRQYWPPVDVATIAILNCADLCTAPNGTVVDPDERIADVLTRYPADHPAHRAVATCAPLLSAQARLVLGAAESAKYAEPRVRLPDRVESAGACTTLAAVWEGERHHLTAQHLGDTHTATGVEIALTDPAQPWNLDDADAAAHDLRAAADAAAGHTLGWTQYRAVGAAADDADRDGTERILALGAATLYVNDIVELHLDMARQGRSILVQQRTIHTLGTVTDWADIADLRIDGPLDWRGPNAVARPHPKASAVRGLTSIGCRSRWAREFFSGHVCLAAPHRRDDGRGEQR